MIIMVIVMVMVIVVKIQVLVKDTGITSDCSVASAPDEVSRAEADSKKGLGMIIKIII